MAAEERSAWVMIVVPILAYATYLGIVLGGGANLPLAPADYGWAVLWTIVGAIAAAVLAEIAFAIVDGIRGERSSGRDERDRRIEQLGEHTGQAFVVIGGLGALILAILEADHFWIANLVYLAFVLSAVLASVTKVVLHRGGLPTW